MRPDSVIESVGGLAAWRADDLLADMSWCRTFTAGEVDAIDRALRHNQTVNPELDLARMTVDDFPIPDLADEIDNLRRELINGRGTIAYEGFPVDRYSADELRAIWWGLNLHTGTAVSQSWRGDLIGDVRDLGTGNTSNVELGFHCDAADATGLFFLRQGERGGVSRIASSVAVHDEILRRRPDLLAVLYRPFTVSCQSNELPGEQPWYDMPVFGRVGDDLACAFVKTNITWAAKNVGAPPLTDEQIEAVEQVAAVAAEPQMWIERRFEAGTMWFVNNQTVLHMRTEFTDHDDPAMKRHLLRIWLSLPNSRPLPDSFATFFHNTEAGAVRGGYPSRNGSAVFSTS
jgi:hypothetical protein